MWGRAIGAAALTTGALLGGAGAAQADPPPGWEPGEGAVEYDFADLGWTHHGWYPGQRGNWHTGQLTFEEDDDGITGQLLDWRCPAGAQPPSPYDPDQESDDCTLKNSRWLEYIQFYDVATIDQASDRMTVNIDVPAYDGAFDPEPSGSVRLDLVIKGLDDAPEVHIDESGEILDYYEIFYDLNAWGKVDGRRIKGPNTTQEAGRMGFWLDGWVRTT